MRKILLSFGALAATIAPITTVLSCNTKLENPKFPFSQNTSTILEAFNNANGSKNIHSDFIGIKKEFDRISNLPEVSSENGNSKLKIVNEFLSGIGIQFANAHLENPNKLSATTLTSEFDSWSQFLNTIKSRIMSFNTESKAKNAGFIDLQQVNGAIETIEKLSSVPIAKYIDNNTVIIGEYLDKNANTVFDAFYHNIKKDVSREWKEISSEWSKIKKLTREESMIARRIFLVSLGKALASKRVYGAGVNNKFISTTPNKEWTQWLEIMQEMDAVVGSFRTDQEAIDFGFIDLNEANEAVRQADYLQYVTKSHSPIDDQIAITIH